MDALVFIAITVVYIAYASRGPSHAMAATAALMTFNQSVPSGFIPGVNIQTIALLLALWAISQSPKNSRVSFPMVFPLFGAILVLGYVHSMFVELPYRYAPLFDGWANFIKFKEWMTTLILCYAAFRAATSVEAAERIVMGGMAGFGAETVFCFLEYLIKLGRVSGHLEEANSTGAYLATYAAFSLGVFVGWKGDKRRWIFLCLGIMGALGTTGTRSRGGFLALGAAFFVTALAKNRLIAIVVLVLGLTYQQWMPAQLLARFDQAYKVDESGHVHSADTAQQRIEIWQAGLRTIPDYPFGLGFGLFRYFVPLYGLEELIPHKPAMNAHNDYVLIAVEFSLVGGLVYIALLLSTLVRAWRASRRDPDPKMRALGSGVLGGTVGAMAATIAISLMFRLDFGGVLWILVGVATRRAAEIKAAPLGKASVLKVPHPAGAK